MVIAGRSISANKVGNPILIRRRFKSTHQTKGSPFINRCGGLAFLDISTPPLTLLLMWSQGESVDLVALSRLQFGLTNIFHFLFVPLTLGLSAYVAFMQTRYYQTKDEIFHLMTRFWGKLFLINIAIGVVSGIVNEFQFGMNWSGFTRFVGDIFGAPLALEALLAFFAESTFIGVWVFGEGKIPEKAHLSWHFANRFGGLPAGDHLFH